MITNAKTHQNNEITSIRDIYKFLDEPMRSMNIAPGANPYEPYQKIIEMIRGLDIQDDGIIMNRKIKAIESDFCNIVQDENMLCESMNYINAKALDDGEIALKFALLFSSRNFDALAMKETKVRSAMLKILETNFLNADTFRMYDKEKLYNSITLLGEYYHRVRLADNSPITILGESLIGLLVREFEGNQEPICWKLAKLVLSQMTLNGDIMRAKHPTQITQLLYHIRRNLVEQSQLSSTTKALLLMTLDLYYSNFANLGVELETFYTKYLVNEEQDEGNNNQHWQQHQQGHGQQLENSQQNIQTAESDVSHDTSREFAESQPPITKKWSEQVCEDSLYESEFLQENELYDESQSNSASDRLNSNSVEQSNPPSHGREYRNSHRMPRPLKHFGNNDNNGSERLSSNFSKVNGEEEDQTKPLPRWRAARFNRDDELNHEQLRSRFRRTSGSFDDDHQSVHSEGGIRLYSLKDRQRHSQEKMDRSSNYNYIVNSNWDRQSQRDDRSERSYISNYEYGNGNGNNQKRNYRNYNNRQTYDKPPRFQKNRKPQQQSPQQQMYPKDNKHFNDNWRRSRTNSNSSFKNEDDMRATTLPRPAKNTYDGNSIKSASFRRSQSPTHHRGNYNGGRYGSQNSVHSEDVTIDSGVGGERNHHQQRHHYPHNQRGNSRRFHPQSSRQHNQHQQQEQQPQQHNPAEAPIGNWEPIETSDVQDPSQENHSELVRNARQTTKYMKYLSSKK